MSGWLFSPEGEGSPFQQFRWYVGRRTVDTRIKTAFGKSWQGSDWDASPTVRGGAFMSSPQSLVLVVGLITLL